MSEIVKNLELIYIHVYQIDKKYNIFSVDLFEKNPSKFFNYMLNNPIDLQTSVNIFHPLGNITFDVKIKMIVEKLSCKPHITLDYFYDIEIFIDNIKIQEINEKIIKICQIAIADYKKDYFNHLMSSAETSLQSKLDYI
jgi:hypothetical protein